MNIEDIYKEYHYRVLNYIKGKVGNTEDAEDICSDVFLKVQNKLNDYDREKAAVSTWVYTIARNSIIDHYRTHRTSEEIPEELASDYEIDESLLNRETLEELAGALRKLSEEERLVIILHYYQNMQLKDIERETGLSYGQVKLRHNSALKKMQKFFSKKSAIVDFGSYKKTEGK
ncbi:MAG: sigma-70 family RNA polymerase sigma factor [Lachnospiraceae bacterium]|nr:sigma-70 family RNA polymerase sigma factor [Lachnospiraceae bacterium]MBQ9605742.1 sigma-70 family RNA polymerase sigma factor [Lachnospiraceae bacterium]